MSLDLKLKRADRIYRPGELVSGSVVVSSKGALSHTGITLVMEGSVQLQLSAKSVGLFEAFYNSIKPIQLLSYTVEIAKPGKLPDGTTELPFEIKLEPMQGQALYDTYHGVFVNIQYNLRVDMKRGVLAKDLQKTLEFIVEVPTSNRVSSPPPEKKPAGKDEKPVSQPGPVPFTITPESLENVKKTSRKHVPNFKLSGRLDTAVCNILLYQSLKCYNSFLVDPLSPACVHINDPISGTVTLESSDAVIKSIELQLVRVETCGCADGYAKEATEIQNIQISEGDVVRGMSIPIYMVFPRLFTCATVAARTFKIEFEINLVVMLEDGHLITENFPIRLVRS
eukprot:TRINITY_DN2831_c0_g1_i3.p1 TRINITY_DN2831_c0_g1~~TRINITY_DN2831_c0_g1_i3.p1  ORF type:complete len:339 (+),score=54.32 TRINITY_DN2831_c0_g1_i3:31-1047(+)